MMFCSRIFASLTFACLIALMPAPLASAADQQGPTIRLSQGQEDSSVNSLAAFMYFVPLISPEPVSIVIGPGSTQSTRVTTATRKVSGNSFVASCGIEFTGTGWQKSVFDVQAEIHKNEQKLKDGGSLQHQLKCIAVEGGGLGSLEVEGTVNGNTWEVNLVKLRFDAHGQTSPATIELCDVKYIDGDFREVNGVIARVNTLTFKRQTGVPKMEVTVASVKDKNAGDGFWQTLKGTVKGVAVNLFIDPLPIAEQGNKAMLDFGLAMVSGSPTYTFPLAPNLREPAEAPAH
ncbi:MAG TPA: hypothetical protein VGN61_11385 [Verrucomicrobiae bacterium]